MNQCEVGGAEISIHAGTVATIGIEQERCGAVLLHSFLVNNGNGNLGAIGGCGHDALGDVVLLLEIAQHRLLLQQGTLFGGHAILESAPWSGHAAVAIAQLVGVEIAVGGEIGGVGRLTEVDVMLLARALSADA